MSLKNNSLIKRLLVSAAVAILILPRLPGKICLADTPADPDSEKARLSYSVGYQVGSDFRRQNTGIDAEMVVRGAMDALKGGDTLMTPREMRQTMVELQEKMTRMRMEEKHQEELATLEEGRAFLEKNGQREGVVTRPSGLQYEILKEGEGTGPGPEDTVTVHYRGTLIDGTEFDSSYRRGEPATFRLDTVVDGWKEGVGLMKPGGRHILYIPPELGYGKAGAGRAVKPNSTLIFEVELVSREGG